ncbi:MAG TPA: PepSY-like domain-containing protein [Bacteroidales bacterium]|nr:PepSY-like domain-containing protein [Bacteroidales bacterium]HSA44774.1 PepSY-like domain-containing protein [Bacteroidales bacterium]
MRLKALLILMILSGSVAAQQIETEAVPQAVQKAFETEYPDAKVKSWEIINERLAANTKIDGQNARAIFLPDGSWIETIYEISEKEMPGRITSWIDQQYAGSRIVLAQYREDKTQGAYYYVQLKKPRSSQEIDLECFFDVSGNFQKKNEFIPLDQAISTSATQEIARKEREEREKAEYQARRAAQLAVDRSVGENDLPARIRDNFRKKFANAEETRWDTLDNVYNAYFFLGEDSVHAEFNPQGDWLKSTVSLEAGPGFRPVELYLEQNYPDYTVKLSQQITTRDRNNSYYAEVHPKVRKNETPQITKLFFDKGGRLLRTEEPAVVEETEDTTEEIRQDEEEVDAFEARLDKEPKKKQQNDEAIATLKVNPKELPSTILNYVKTNYPDLVIREAYFSDYEDVGNAYRVVISKEGVRQVTSDLYFSDYGKLLKEVNPPPKKEIQTRPVKQAKEEKPVVEDKQVYDDPEEVVLEEAEETEANEEDIRESYEVSDSDIPDVVKKNFSRRYPRAEEVLWKTDDSTFAVEFYLNGIKNILEMSPGGIIQATRTEMDPRNLFGPVQRYLDDNFPGYKVRYAEKIVRKDRKNFFYVEIYSKKRNANPPEAYLFFDKAGRFMENPPE